MAKPDKNKRDPAQENEALSSLVAKKLEEIENEDIKFDRLQKIQELKRLIWMGRAKEKEVLIKTERERDIAREESITDGLTGVYNRRYLIDRLPKDVEHAKRHGYQLGVIMLDIDNFKKVNDEKQGGGHLVGDRVLRLLGKLLKSNLREGDYVARYGGEEFTVVLPSATPEQTEQVAEKLREAVANSKEDPMVTISLGYSNISEDTEGEEDLLKRADAALYASKKAGKNRVTREARPAAQQGAEAAAAG